MRVLCLLALILAGCAPSEPPLPVARDAWVRAAPPDAGMTAGYLNIDNPGDRPMTLTGVHSDAFERIELHTTIMEDGVARMRMEESVAIAPGETVAFEPGGRHLMMFGAKRPLGEDDAVRLVLTFLTGDERPESPLELAVEATVRRGGGSHAHHH